MIRAEKSACFHGSSRKFLSLLLEAKNRKGNSRKEARRLSDLNRQHGKQGEFYLRLLLQAAQTHAG